MKIMEIDLNNEKNNETFHYLKIYPNHLIILLQGNTETKIIWWHEIFFTDYLNVSNCFSYFPPKLVDKRYLTQRLSHEPESCL